MNKLLNILAKPFIDIFCESYELYRGGDCIGGIVGFLLLATMMAVCLNTVALVLYMACVAVL
jgi:hypothetical protein